MASENRLFDDLARVAGGAMGALAGVRQEVEARFREQMERWLASMDLVTREEFDAVKAMAAKARTEQEGLERRLAALEAALAERAPARARAPKGRPAAAGESGDPSAGDPSAGNPPEAG